MPQKTSHDPQDQTPSPTTAPAKTSYEANEEVQRWLRAQADERLGDKPPFTPTFLAHQRDRLWALSALELFYEEGLISNVLSAIKSGKEANVYLCAAGPATGVEYLAAKVYRPRMFRSLKNDAVYRRSRAQRDAEGRTVRDDRRWRAHQRSGQGHAERVASWISYEYETQRLLYEAGADVPQPIAQRGNAALMAYVGDAEDAAPLLREVELTPEEARPLFDRLMENIARFLACHRIHGDLSAYNILYLEGVATIIDFAQAVDPRYNEAVYPLLARDVARVCRYFTRYGVEADAEELAADLWSRYLVNDL